MEIDRPLRAARAAVFAAACLGVSAAGHLWMSGAAIPAWALLVAVIAAGLAGHALAGRQRGFASIAALMLVGELGLHALFAAAQHTVTVAMSTRPFASSMPAMSSMAGMIMPHKVPASTWLCGGGKAGLGAAAAQATSLPTSIGRMFAHHMAGMVAVHTVAGLAAAWWLRRGEAATFRLLRTLARLAAPMLAILWPKAPSVPNLISGVPDGRDRLVTPRRGLLVHAVVRRGPPSSVFCM